jgi:hypothetical protein
MRWCRGAVENRVDRAVTRPFREDWPGNELVATGRAPYSGRTSAWSVVINLEGKAARGGCVSEGWFASSFAAG